MAGLTLAIPSKGRLKDNAAAWLERCGFRLRQVGGARGYAATLDGLDGVSVLLLSAREIALGLLDGSIHAGITGEDLLHDLARDLPAQVGTLKPLGFGRADAVVAVPKAWLDVATMADLDAAGAAFRKRSGRRFRVATKYLSLTRRFFADRAVGEYLVVESAGATEAAPAAGSADLIVDITSSGATLAANDLKVLSDGVILRSQAVLAGSLSADWTHDALDNLSVLMDAVEAEARARDLRRLTAGKPIPAKLARQFNLTHHQGETAYCRAGEAIEIAREMSKAGLAPVSIAQVHFLFTGESPSLRNFIAKIEAVS